MDAEDLERKAIPALHRAAQRYDAVLARSGGNRPAAASLLWKRSRSNAALREDLLKASCLLIAAGRAKVQEAECES